MLDIRCWIVNKTNPKNNSLSIYLILNNKHPLKQNKKLTFPPH